ncbi:MAG: dihydroorotate dehydrogenase electron transfer subunit [Bacteroidota bacterium]
MKQEFVKIQKIEEFQSGIFELTFASKYISKNSKPGQFLNIRVDNSYQPFLRRPFSISNIDEDSVKIIFNAIGQGTKKLIHKNINDELDVIGPLGNGFKYEENTKTAFLIGGGLGIAPLPFLSKFLKDKTNIFTILGARTSNQIIRKDLFNFSVATDDGTEGFHGNVVDLAKKIISEKNITPDVIYACGPTPMLKAIANFANQNNIKCFASWECEMACGIGLCQGCPIEFNDSNKKYHLVCKEGPVIETSKIKL